MKKRKMNEVKIMEMEFEKYAQEEVEEEDEFQKEEDQDEALEERKTCSAPKLDTNDDELRIRVSLP